MGAGRQLFGSVHSKIGATYMQCINLSRFARRSTYLAAHPGEHPSHWAGSAFEAAGASMAAEAFFSFDPTQ
eukprot:814431-Pleurochrysis_carterae.AAC.1